MAKNKSKAYGYYGGVTNANHYVPPGSVGFIPQPATRPFTAEDREKFDQVMSQAAYIRDNASDIMIRTNTASAPNNIDTFVISTSGKPEDVIVYTSDTDVVNLNVTDGGYF
jgi:hypothetical protein